MWERTCICGKWFKWPQRWLKYVGKWLNYLTNGFKMWKILEIWEMAASVYLGNVLRYLNMLEMGFDVDLWEMAQICGEMT